MPDNGQTNLEGDDMICNYNKLSRFVEGVLDLDDRLQILLHLEVCNQCFDEVYRLRKLEDEEFFVHKKYKRQKMAS